MVTKLNKEINQTVGFNHNRAKGGFIFTNHEFSTPSISIKLTILTSLSSFEYIFIIY